MSKLLELVSVIKTYKFKDSQGHPLGGCVDYQRLLRLCSEAYVHGAVNGVRKFAFWRKGKRVVGPFDKPMEDIIKEYEEKFKMKYKRHGEMDNLLPLDPKKILGKKNSSS